MTSDDRARTAVSDADQGSRVSATRTMGPGLVAVAVALAACASHPGPIIDRKGVDPVAYERDLAECSKYASEIQVASGAAKGAVAGGAYGAAVGSIHGNASQGAGTGAISGAAWSALDADREKN
jgi:outer membrane lipoprotein SlyB